MNQQKNNGNLIAIITMFFLFAMISFVTNLAAPIGTIWKGQFGDSGVLGMLGNFMNFLAYLFMGIPAGKMLEKIGYKKTALTALAVGFIGLFVQYLSGVVGSDPTVGFSVYLTGAFICGFSVCMLNTVVNPMLNLLGGGGNKGNQLIQTGGALNSLSGTLTPLFVGALIGTITKETSIADVNPLLFLAMGIFVVSFLIILAVAIPEPNANKGVAVKNAHSPWSFRHFVLGGVAIFLYVGIEVGIPGTLIFYLSAESTGLGAGATAIAGAIAAIYWLLMLVGRSLSSVISGKVSSRTQLIAVSVAGIAFVALAIFMPESIKVSMPGFADGAFIMKEVPISAMFLVLCGLCTSVMWGGIFNLAVEGLGKYTAQASGIFMMMVVGGGVLPLIQNAIADSTTYMTSYWLVIAVFAYMLYYGLIGSKNVNKDIPVE
ncbi:MAG: sugar MFS transporter [Bacteroides sp.]|nr:sugar MFS transporter [Bacteroides sp.]